MSNNNNFSESQFKTQKYHPNYSGRFNDIRQARLWTGECVTWYNTENHHSGLASFAPEQVFTGQHHKIVQAKPSQAKPRLPLYSGYQNHPARCVKGRLIVPMQPKTITINLITLGNNGEYKDDRAHFPTMTAVGHVN